MKNKIVGILSVGVTPLLVFLSTSNYLFLINEKAFSSEYSLLLTFIPHFTLLYGIGLLLYFTSKLLISRSFLLLYYGTGPLFAAFSYAHHNYDLTLVTPKLTYKFFLFISLLSITFFWYKRKTITSFPKAFSKLFSTLFIALLALELLSFFNGFKGKTFHESRGLPTYQMEKSKSERPNIYHIILDGFQTEAFIKLLSEIDPQHFKGFTLYKNNLSNYEYTYMSTASFITGQLHKYEVPTEGYLKNIFETPYSLFKTLKSLGYSTLGIMNSGIITKRAKFDKKVYLNDFVYKMSVGDTNPVKLKAIFKHLWMHRNIPRHWRETLRAKGLYPYTDDPILPNFYLLRAAEGMGFYIDQENTLSAKGRYTYLHPVMPHRPYVLDSKCRQSNDPFNKLAINQAYLEQARCATSLLIKLIKKLKELDRFNNSLIIVHSDHGEWFTDPAFTIDRDTGRAHALLLIKPLHFDTQKNLVISDRPTSLLDILPTIFAQINYKSKYQLDGQDVFSNSYTPYQRKFHTYSHHEEETSSIKSFNVYTAKDGENIKLIKKIETGH